MMMNPQPRAQRDRIRSRDELWAQAPRGVRRDRTHSNDDPWIEAANGVLTMECLVRRVSKELGDTLSEFQSYLDRSTNGGSTRILDRSNRSTCSMGAFGNCDFDLEEPQVKDCLRASIDDSYRSPRAVLPPAPGANGAAPGLFRGASVQSSDTIVSADAGPTGMRAAQIARRLRLRAAQIARMRAAQIARTQAGRPREKLVRGRGGEVEVTQV